MAHKLILTDEQKAWLRTAIENGDTYESMADEIGCHSDTLKRAMMRQKLAVFETAKFLPKVKDTIIMWVRPCSLCGCDIERPKWQYRCDHCHTLQKDNKEISLPTSWTYS